MTFVILYVGSGKLNFGLANTPRFSKAAAPAQQTGAAFLFSCILLIFCRFSALLAKASFVCYTSAGCYAYHVKTEAHIMSEQLLFLLVILGSYTIQALTGFGGPLIAMPIGIALVGVELAKPVVTFAAWLTSLAVMLPNLKYVNWRELIKMDIVMFIFMIAGLWIFKTVKMSYLQVIYGVIVVLIGIKKLIKPSSKPMPPVLSWCSICLAGVMQGLFVSGGSFLVIYAVSAIHDKREFRATMSSVWATVNVMLLVSYALDGTFTPAAIKLTVLSLIPIAAAIIIGSVLAKKLGQKHFMLVTYLLLIVSGAILLITNI